MSQLFTQEEWDELNEIGIKALTEQERYKNRYVRYGLAISFAALIVSILALIISFISLVH